MHFEISVPHAYTNWGDDSLKKVYEHKLNKYRELVEFLRSRNIEVQIYPTIVSSLGAVYKDTISDLNKVFTQRSKCKTLIKRLYQCRLGVFENLVSISKQASSNYLLFGYSEEEIVDNFVDPNSNNEEISDDVIDCNVDNDILFHSLENSNSKQDELVTSNSLNLNQ